MAITWWHGTALAPAVTLPEFGPFGRAKITVATDGAGAFVVSWTLRDSVTASQEIYARRFDSAGTPLGQKFLVHSHAFGEQYNRAIAMNGDGDWVMAWNGEGPSGPGLYARMFDAAGMPKGAEFLVDAVTGANPLVAIDESGNVAVTWVRIPTSGARELYLRRYNALGTPQGLKTLITSHASLMEPPSLAMTADGDVVVSWTIGSLAVYAQTFSRSGLPQTEAFQVSPTYNSAGLTQPSISVDAEGNLRDVDRVPAVDA
jgi:hypothetical protein